MWHSGPIGPSETDSRGRTLRHQQVDVVAADKVLRHADDGGLQALLAVVVRGVLRHVP